MQVKDVKAALLARGTMLFPPAGSVELEELSHAEKAGVDKAILDIFSEFNGFKQEDQKSQICVWPIARILGDDIVEDAASDANYVAFGDIMLDSDFIMWCTSDATLPVYLLHERRQLASSVISFFEKLAAGGYDLVD